MTDKNGRPIPDLSRYSRNKRKYPPEDLMKYAGQWVAWNTEGTQVLAAAEDLDGVIAALVAAGHDPQFAVYDHRDPLDVNGYL